jgi:hypothetical protein
MALTGDTEQSLQDRTRANFSRTRIAQFRPSLPHRAKCAPFSPTGTCVCLGVISAAVRSHTMKNWQTPIVKGTATLQSVL